MGYPIAPGGEAAGLAALLGSGYCGHVIRAEEVVGAEWAEWYRLTPQQRFAESEKLWQSFLALGGSLDPEPDTQSPFFDRSQAGPGSPHGGPGLRLVRRGRV